jgi:3-hydroxyisobutyrate dehydrogenase-like beta-hydroxyacid dehydrogenase
MGDHIGFIGLGRMGARMGARLLDAGHTLTVYDVSDEAVARFVARGARKMNSPAGVADAAEIVLASLPSPAIVQNTAIGASGVIHGKRVKTFIDLSTTGPRVATAVAGALAEKSIAALDAPVSGGVTGAEKGTLSMMVSGPRAAYDGAENILKNFGRLFFMGDKPGLGQTMKLVNNLLAACSMAITSEGVAMGLKAGLDPKTMMDVLNVSSGRSSATLEKWPRAVLPRSFDVGFATALSFKDVRLCLDEAEAMGVPMVVGSVVRQMLAITLNTYGPDSDVSDTARLLEAWADLDLPRNITNRK